MFDSKTKISPQLFNKQFQDAAFEHNKQLSQSNWMSFNWRTTLRNSNLCYLGPHIDFRNFIKANMEHANMNLFITDRDLSWHAQLRKMLELAGYNIIILRDTQSFKNQYLEPSKQAVFMNIADENTLGAFYTQWMCDAIQSKQCFSTPVLFIPGVALPNSTEQIMDISQCNVHLTLHGENIEAVKRMESKDFEIILGLCHTLIVSDMSHPDTARYVHRRIKSAQELASLPPRNPNSNHIQADPPLFSIPDKHFKPLKLKKGECFVLVTGILPSIDKKL